jgi:hypothetical protein
LDAGWKARELPARAMAEGERLVGPSQNPEHGKGHD